MIKLVFFAYLVGACVVNAQELRYFATYRDLIPSGCMVLEKGGRTVPFEDEYLAAWNITDDEAPCRGSQGVINSRFCTFTYVQDGDDDCDASFVTEEWMDYFMDGRISGHPDFEFEGFFNNVAGAPRADSPMQSTVTKRDGPFPIGACVAAGGDQSNCNSNYPNGALTRIVKDDLFVHKSGLYKMDYCESDPDARCGGWLANTDTTKRGGEFGFANGEGPLLHQTRKKYFDSWFVDDEKYNKRIGQTLKLTERNGAFEFDSFVDDENEEFTSFTSTVDSHFGPLDRFKDRTSTEEVLASDYPNPFDAPAWPNFKRVGLSKVNKHFIFTTEIHAFFKYQGGEQLTFFGDDDMWVFINGKMALDTGGWHEALQGTVNVTKFESELDLTIGETYELDLYHAERHHGGSNFKLTSTLLPECNVQFSGTVALSFNDSPNLEDELFASREVTVDSNTVTLLTSAQLFKSNFVWTKQEFNLGTGFQLTFNVDIGNSETQGFAFVAHNRPEKLVNLPLSAGRNLNLKGLENSFAIVFDLCSSQAVNCTREVRLHYPDAPEQRNNVKNTTKRVNDDAVHTLKKGRTTAVFIQYLQDPDWLEVYLDQSLYLRQKSFTIEAVVGGRNAFIGFTTASGATSADLVLTDVEMSTVSVDASQTVFDDFNYTKQEVVADGELESEGLKVQSRDSCLNEISFSEADYLDNNVGGYYVLRGNETRRRLSDNSSGIFAAKVRDNGDGTYSLALSTTQLGDFDLFAWAGDPACDYDIVDDELVAPLGQSGCVYSTILDAAATRPLTESPTASPTPLGTIPVGESEEVVTLLATGGSVLGILAIFATVLLLYRRKWQKEKDFIEDGQLYRLDATTNFDPNNKLNIVGRDLINTSTAILNLTARSTTKAQSKQLEDLMSEQENIRQQIAELKRRTQQMTTAEKFEMSMPPPKPTGGNMKKEF